MKYCKYCSKELTKTQKRNTYCSNECAQKSRAETKINSWLDDKYDAIIGTDQLSSTIRNYLLEKAQYKCQRCGWGKENRFTNKVPLDIHHKDGNHLNNSKDNLEVLCPNCHSLTPNYKSLNKYGRKNRTQSRKKYCIDCKKEIVPSALRCRECFNKHRIVETPINKKELKSLIRIKSFIEIGKLYNVSDNAIRKWCIKCGLPSKRKDIIAFSDEEWALL